MKPWGWHVVSPSTAPTSSANNFQLGNCIFIWFYASWEMAFIKPVKLMAAAIFSGES